MATFGQLIIGPPGSGKSTYCFEMQRYLIDCGRKVAIINLDPANDILPYTADIDINEYVTTEDVMNYYHIGPNNATLFCIEFFQQYINKICDCIKEKEDHYFLIDCPGQIEIYTHHDALKNLIFSFDKINLRLCCVHLIDAHYCSDVGKFISALLLSLTAMLHLALPHVNILSKIDLLNKFSKKLTFRVDYYTEVLDLSYLLESLDQDVCFTKYAKLNKILASFVEDYSLVTFIPMNVKDRKYLVNIQNIIDKANGYIFGSNEDRNVQKLLSSVMCNNAGNYTIDEEV